MNFCEETVNITEAELEPVNQISKGNINYLKLGLYGDPYEKP
jgi:hypothetical protein